MHIAEFGVLVVKDGAKVRHEAIPSQKYVPNLAPHGVHDEIRDFERGLGRSLAHEIAVHRYFGTVLGYPQVTKCLFDQAARTVRSFEDELDLIGPGPPQYIDNSIPEDQGHRFEGTNLPWKSSVDRYRSTEP